MPRAAVPPTHPPPTPPHTPGQNNGRISQAKDWLLGQTSNYTYDALNRLSTVSIVETGTGEQMSYDGFGNVTGMNGAAVWTHNPATNQVAVAGWTYDGNGRVLTDPNGTYTWDIEGRMIEANGAQLSYDPDGKLVQDGTGAFYVWSVTGQKLGTYTVTWNGSGTPTITNVTKIGYFKGKRIGVAQDRLGTVRWGAGVSQTTYRSYGTETPYTAIGPEMWATYQQMGAGLDYADQRMYNPQMGKFFSPDPGGVKTARPKKPVSWNRYLYGNGDSVNFLDPAGRIVISAEQCAQDPDSCEADDWNSVYGTGGDFGGPSDSDNGEDGDDGSDSGTDPDASCVEQEAAYEFAYLNQFPSSPLDNWGLILTNVETADSAGYDPRFIIALGCVETSYGTNVSPAAGKNNIFSNGYHCAALQGFCQAIDPYPSPTAALTGAISTLSSAPYAPYETAANIYSVYEEGNVKKAAPAQSTLDAIYGKQLQGQLSDVKTPRCAAMQ